MKEILKKRMNFHRNVLRKTKVQSFCKRQNTMIYVIFLFSHEFGNIINPYCPAIGSTLKLNY